ncbi:serine hydrolase domain-containing protein [Pseudobythopirellula maris]|uniref:serine hydrolase domain-containing protein n=1 Tax=Pseudobythopirellula maris TaxID=2527991 RepID=UPI0018D323B6|nr:serine hydrolase domain-containing protein [Pseudobythopirellula maris]
MLTISDTHAADPVTDYEPVITRLESFITAELQAKQLPAASIALVADDRVVWSAGFGPAKQEGPPASVDTTYRVGSVSKLFNALAVMRLVAEGKVDLDEDVRTYLPDFAPQNPFDKPITLRLLMSHQSGLVRESPLGSYFDATSPTIAATVASLNDTTVLLEPGSKTKYSNAAVTVAGLVVERVSGQPYSQYVQRAVLEPLGMGSSSFRPTEAINARLPDAWMWSFHSDPFPAPTFDMGILPAGNLCSTVTDLSKMLIVMLGDQPPASLGIDRALLDSMIRPASPDSVAGHEYGIAFRLGELDGRPTFGHGGAVYGYATQFKGLRDEKIGVVVALAQDCANGETNRIGDYALRLMLAHRAGEPLPEISTSGPLAAGEAKQMAGRYTNGSGQAIEIYAKGERAFLKHGHWMGELRCASDGYLIDDVLRHGPALQWDGADGVILLDGKEWRPTDDENAACPPEWRELVGEYGWDHNVMYIYEDHGRLRSLIEWFFDYPLTELGEDAFAFPDSGLYHDEKVVFRRNEHGEITHAVAGGVAFPRRPSSGADDSASPYARIAPDRQAE